MPLTPDASPLTIVLWNLAALAAIGGLYYLLWVAVGRARRGTPALDAALTFALFVCAEAALLDILSLGGLVGRPGVLGAHAVLVGAIIWALCATKGGVPQVWRSLPRVRWWWWWTLVPLVVLVGASMIRYAPNSGDSMTYHLARVAHWIQNGSIGPYPSLSVRQTVMMPGAEYVITALMAVAGSDHLAALPQFGAWIVVTAAAPTLARLCGAPSRWSWLAAPVVMAAPMTILQASSTQNDLVASAVTVAVVAASLPFLHRRRCSRAGAILLLGAACAAAGLTKGSAVIAAAPFAIVAVISLVRVGLPKGRSAIALVAAVMLVVVLVLPESARRDVLSRTQLVVDVYGASDSWVDRLANVGRGAAHHLATPFALGEAANSPAMGMRRPNMPSRAHEDFAGNPLQFALAMAMLVTLLVRWRRVPLRARLLTACWLAGWVVFHVIVKDNEYLSRLHVPWFATMPVLAGALAGIGSGRGKSGWAIPLAAALLIANGAWMAAYNEIRPPLVVDVGPRENHYFMNGSLAMAQQRDAVRLAREAGCGRLALFMGESGFDYPISRAAMAAGMTTRHLLVDDGWACAIYVERLSWGHWNLPRAQVALDNNAWSAAAMGPGGPFVFLRRPTP